MTKMRETTNIWHALATIEGNVDNITDTKIISENALYWNSYMAQLFASEDYSNLRNAKQNLIFPSEFHPKSLDEINEKLKANFLVNGETPELPEINDSLNIDFKNFHFNKPISFHGFAFLLDTNFSDSIFEGDADFYGATFGKEINFNYTNFKGRTIFQDSSFEWFSSFSGATFENPPLFYNASLYPDTRLNNINIIEKYDDKDTILNYIRTFEHLALLMHEQQRVHDEHFFFQKEMRARRKLASLEKHFSEYTFNKIYDCISTYGYGLTRSFSFWALHIFLGGFLLKKFGGVTTYEKALAVSFSNSHSFLGLKNQNFLQSADTYNYWFNVISFSQTIIGVLLLFFLLLCLRNRFRIH